jgi:butyryl-CoA dehydrogenase
MEGGRGLQLLAGRINATIEKAIQQPELAVHANALGKALQQVGRATKAAWATGEPGEALANAVPYMQAFGHTVLAWLWLDVALASLSLPQDAPHAGRMGAMRYFYHYELPKIDAWLKVVENRDLTCADLPEEAF